MTRLLLTIFIAFILLLLSHSVKAQQLPDSLLAQNEPMMLLPDSSLPAVVAVGGDSIFGYQPISISPWPIIGGYGEGYPWPGFYTLTVTEFPSYCVTWILIDSTLFIPRAESIIGAQANVVSPRKIPDASQASAFADCLHRFTAKKERE